MMKKLFILISLVVSAAAAKCQYQYLGMSTSSTNSSSNTITISPLAGAQVGDFGFLIVCMTTETAATFQAVGGPSGSGITFLAGAANNGNVGSLPNAANYIRVAPFVVTGTPGNVTASITSSGTFTTSGAMYWFRHEAGHEYKNKWRVDGSPSFGLNDNTNSYTLQSKTTTLPNIIVFNLGVTTGLVSFTSVSNGWTLAGQFQNTALDGNSVWGAYKIITAPGSSGASTLSISTGSGHLTRGHTINMGMYGTAYGFPIYYF